MKNPTDSYVTLFFVFWYLYVTLVANKEINSSLVKNDISLLFKGDKVDLNNFVDM